MNPENERGDRMCNAFYEVVDLATGSEDQTKMVMDWIKWLTNELKSSAGVCESSLPTSLTSEQLNIPSLEGDINIITKRSATIRSPLTVRSKGRPPFKRLQGITEKCVQRKKQQKKNEKESASHNPHGSQGKSTQRIASPFDGSNGKFTQDFTSASHVQGIASQFDGSRRKFTQDFTSGSHVQGIASQFDGSRRKFTQDFTSGSHVQGIASQFDGSRRKFTQDFTSGSHVQGIASQFDGSHEKSTQEFTSGSHVQGIDRQFNCSYGKSTQEFASGSHVQGYQESYPNVLTQDYYYPFWNGANEMNIDPSYESESRFDPFSNRNDQNINYTFGRPKKN